MLNNFKNKAPEQDRSTVANDLEFLQPQRPVAETVALRSERTKSGPASCIGSGMSVIGKIDCDGPAQIFGRIEGELRASDLPSQVRRAGPCLTLKRRQFQGRLLRDW